jgi:outer membrane receptor protein involved in Fe transport
VPDAAFRDIAVFVQDEWRIRPYLALTAGVRADFYRVTTEETPGYDVGSVVAGADPAIDPATLPDPNGTTITRRALTGDVGLLINPGGTVSPFVRVGRSYRHPNLEELLFAGPATIGSLAPNILVKPETGTNLDVGATFRIGRVSGGAFAFVNRYRDYIAQDIVSATTPFGALSQALNFGNVRVAGVELSAEAPILIGPGAITLSGAAAFTRGTITEGQGPFGSLDDTPLDNITPVKGLLSVRFTERRARWWAEYGVRAQTEVERVATTLLESPFIIAQDLLSLDGFVIHRLGWGVRVPGARESLAVVFAVENLTDRFYREQFQFAPARGRTFTIGLSLGAH